jgi:hypothetical protein
MRIGISFPVDAGLRQPGLGESREGLMIGGHGREGGLQQAGR